MGAWVEYWDGKEWDEWGWFEDVEEAFLEAARIGGRIDTRVRWSAGAEVMRKDVVHGV